MQFLATSSFSYHTAVLAFLILVNENSVRAQDLDWTTTPEDYQSASTTFATPPQPTPTSSDDISLLRNCASRGSYFCSWSAQANVGIQSYKYMVGSPLSNCFGGTYRADSDVRVSFTTTDTWSTGLNAGVQIGPMSFGFHSGWSNTQSHTLEQDVTIHVPPNQQGAIIALVDYNVTLGSATVGSTVVSPAYINQPTGKVKFNVEVIDCDQTFDTNTTSPSPASSGALLTPMLSSIVYVSAILAGMACVIGSLI